MKVTSKGIKQVGWATANLSFDPEKYGVGDDDESWAYDGNRGKLWHGKNGTKEYGSHIQWREGDVVGILLDFDNKIMRFRLNDEDLGIAFENFDLGENLALYPAVSFSRKESAEFVFALEDLTYSLPDGHYPLLGDHPISQIRDNPKRLAARVHRDVLNHGFGKIRSGDYYLCNSIASELARFGMIVTVNGSDDLKSYVPGHVVLPNLTKHNVYSKLPIYTGSSNSLVASEWVNLFRWMLSLELENSWNLAAMDTLMKSLLNDDLPKENRFDIPNSSHKRAIGALAVLGGFNEFLRPGGFVEVNEERAVVIEDTGGSDVYVAFSKKSTRSEPCLVQKIDRDNVIPTSEFDVDLANIMTPALFEILGAMVVFSNDHARSFYEKWWTSECQWRAMQVLSGFVGHAGAQHLDQTLLASALELVARFASQCALHWKLDSVSNDCLYLRCRVWYMLDDAFKYFVPVPYRIQSHEAAELDFSMQAMESRYVYGQSGYDDDLMVSNNNKENKMLKYWEKNIIPRVQDYVRSSFKEYEMEYFFESLRQPLRSQNQEAAVKIAYTLCGGRLPDGVSIPSNDRDWSTSMLDDVSVGMEVSVAPSARDNAVFEEGIMLHLIGRRGRIKAIHPKSELVLVQFEFPHESRFEDWWFDVESVKVEVGMDDTRSSLSQLRTIDDVVEALSDLELSMSKLVGRRAMFALCSRSKSFLEEQWHNSGGIIAKLFEFVLLAVSEVLDLSSLVNPGKPKTRRDRQLLRSLEDNLAEVLTLAPSRDVVLTGLKEEFQKLVEASSTFTFDNLAFKDQDSSKAIRIPGAGLIIVTFSNDTIVEPGNSLIFYGDAQCRDEIRGYSGGVAGMMQIKPLVISGDSFWINCVGRVNYKLTLTPVHPRLGLAFWLIDFLLENWIDDNIDDICDICDIIMEKFRFIELGASPLKEEIVGMLLNTLSKVKATESMGKLINTLENLKAVHDEMLEIVGREYSFEVHTSYAQQLINLCVVSDSLRIPEHRLCSEFKFAEDTTSKDGDKDTEAEPEQSGWNCALCTFLNIDADNICMICESPKPMVQISLMSGDEDGDQNRKYATGAFDDMVCLMKIMQYLVGELNRDECEDLVMQLLRLSYDELDGGRNEVETRLFVLDGIPPPSDYNETHPDQWDFGGAHSLLFNEIRSFRISKSSLFIGVDPSKEVPKEHQANENDEPIMEFRYDSDFDENGLFYYLGSNCKTEPWNNPCNMGLIEVHSSSVQHDSEPPYSAAGRETVRCVTEASENSWFKFQLLNNVQVSPSHYTLRHYISWHNEALRSWRFEGSNDGENWTVLRDHKDDQKLDAKGATGTWDIEGHDDEYFSMFRVYQTDVNSNQNFYLALSGFELYGKVKGVRVRPPPRESNVFAIVELLSDDEKDHTEFIEQNQNRLLSWRFDYLSNLQITKYSDMASDDPRIQVFMRSKLFHSNVDEKQDTGLTSSFASALENIFEEFRPKDGQILRLTDLKTLFSFGGVIDSDEDFAIEMAKNDLDLQGLSNLVCNLDPKLVWKWLTALGFDFNLVRNQMSSFDTTVSTFDFWEHQTSRQIHRSFLNLVAECCDRSGEPNPLKLKPSQFVVDPVKLKVLFNEGSEHLLAGGLRLRFLFLKQFNSILSRLLPLVDLRRAQYRSVGEIIRSCRDFIFRGVKVEFIEKILTLTSLDRPRRPMISLNRIELASRDGEISDFLQQTCFGISFQQLRSIGASGLRPRRPVGAEPFLAFEVVIKGEHVVGLGGPYRQFFTDVSKDLIREASPLFMPCPNRYAAIGDNQDKYIIRPSSSKSNVMLELFEYLGVLFGCCIRTGVRFTLDLPAFFWKPLVGDLGVLSDLRAVDVRSAQVLEDFKNFDEKEFEKAFSETFEFVLSDHETIELKDNGSNIPVDFESRLEFVQLALKARLSEAEEAIDSIRHGLGKLLPIQLLNLLTWEECEVLISGRASVDVNLLRRHTEYSGIESTHPCIEYFWEVLEEMSERERRDFVRFSWAQERLPADDEEFAKSHTRLLIKGSTASGADDRFPKADTCFFNLELPAYSSKEILRERLMFAISNTHTMDADQNAGDLHGNPADMRNAFLH